MLEALRILKEHCDHLGVRVWLRHVAGEDNRIADRLSRGDWAEADTHAKAVRLPALRKSAIGDKVDGWIKRVCQAALSARTRA